MHYSFILHAKLLIYSGICKLLHIFYIYGNKKNTFICSTRQKRLILYFKLKAYKEKQYPVIVSQYIRLRYSIDDEFAILRQRDTKPDEYEEYNSYCEECKARAKAIVENPYRR